MAGRATAQTGGRPGRPLERARRGRGAARPCRADGRGGARCARRGPRGERRVGAARESTSTARWPASGRGTSCSRGRSAGSGASPRCCRELADLGFDVVYLPPVHPIGLTNRKGRNNAEHARPGDVGSPWAIGNADGGHDALNPELGTHGRLRRHGRRGARRRARDRTRLRDPVLARSPVADRAPRVVPPPPGRDAEVRRESAQALPGHLQRELRLAEKWRALWRALRDVVLHWVGRGITVFRVDNPHTKPIPFWEWLIREVRSRHPEVIFLAEAFTRPVADDDARQGRLRAELYVLHLEEHEARARGVHPGGAQLVGLLPSQHVREHARHPQRLPPGRRPARRSRRGSCSPRRSRRPTGSTPGFESYERVPVRPGSEEYLDSEKYEVKQRRLDGPLLPLVRKLNEVRRALPALQRFDNLRWLETESDHLVAYAKDDVICVVNVDPTTRREGICVVPPAPGLSPSSRSRDLLARRDVRVADRPELRGARRPARASAERWWRRHDRARQLVRAESALVQDVDLLRDPHAWVLRRQ